MLLIYMSLVTHNPCSCKKESVFQIGTNTHEKNAACEVGHDTDTQTLNRRQRRLINVFIVHVFIG